jgi:TatA/E family protein of Tat protein translocase
LSVFGIGPSELILVFVLALIFIGPNKMPEIALSLGKALREFQKASAELTEALNAEVEAAQARKATEQNGTIETAEISEAEVVATPIAESVAEPVVEAQAPSLDSITITPVAEPVVEAEPAAALVNPPLPDPTGMAPLPLALVEPSDSMRARAAAEPAVIAEPVAMPVNPPQPDPMGTAPLPLALLEPSDSRRAAEARSVSAPAKSEASHDDESISSTAAAIEPDATGSTEAAPSTVLVEA